MIFRRAAAGAAVAGGAVAGGAAVACATAGDAAAAGVMVDTAGCGTISAGVDAIVAGADAGGNSSTPGTIVLTGGWFSRLSPTSLTSCLVTVGGGGSAVAWAGRGLSICNAMMATQPGQAN